MKTAARRWIWRFCALAPVPVVLYSSGVAHAGKPAPARPAWNGPTLLVAPGQAPYVVVRSSPFNLTGPGVGGLVVPPGTLVLAPQADLSRSVDRCLVPVRDVDPRFIVTPRVTDERMVVAPAVVGRPVNSRP
jgi:hypothetical protein